MSMKTMEIQYFFKKALTSQVSMTNEFTWGATLEGMFGKIDDIQAEVFTESWDPNLQIGIRGQLSGDALTWQDFAGDIITLYSPTVAAPTKVSSPYTTRSDFASNLRFGIVIYGSAASLSGIASVKITIRFAS